MADSIDDIRMKLTRLAPTSRARVESALKSHLEAALAEESKATEADLNVKQFSRGILFSKSGSALRNGEEVMLPSIAEMDDAKFQKFMERINTLKGTKG